jgi:predicted heme/steroid binding protein
MAVVGITGILLTVSRIKGLGVLIESPWGLFLSLKILLYIIMVCSALFVVFFVGPRLRKGVTVTAVPKSGIFDPVTLSGFDGREGRSAYIAYRGEVYDVSSLKLWKGGSHMNHHSGTDLTDSIDRAPHGDEKVENLPVVGSYDPARKPEKTIHQKTFYLIAYLNLAFVFALLFVIAFWRWGI